MSISSFVLIPPMRPQTRGRWRQHCSRQTEATVSTTTPPSDSFLSAPPYRKIFLSYSHDNTEIVEQAERLGAALGDTYLRDRTTLHSGQDWSKELLKLIDGADIFQTLLVVELDAVRIRAPGVGARRHTGET
jgi:hypothetical protein